jgi:hypothetical protein
VQYRGLKSVTLLTSISLIYSPKKTRNSRRGRKLLSIVCTPRHRPRGPSNGHKSLFWCVCTYILHLLLNVILSITTHDGLGLLILMFFLPFFDQFIAFIVAGALIKSLSLRCRCCCVYKSPEMLPEFFLEHFIWTLHASTNDDRLAQQH